MRDRDQPRPVGDRLDDLLRRYGHDPGRRGGESAEEAEVLDVARHDLVVRAQVEAREHDVAALGGRPGEGDVLRRHGQERRQARPHLLAQPEHVSEVGLAAPASGKVGQLFGDEGLDGRTRERPVRTRVQVREVVEHGERGACFLEGQGRG